MTKRALRWWDNHHLPFFFGWVWVLILSFTGGALGGLALAIWTLKTRGLW